MVGGRTRVRVGVGVRVRGKVRLSAGPAQPLQPVHHAARRGSLQAEPRSPI